MSGAGARANQNAVRSKAGVMTAAALFYLSGAMETDAGNFAAAEDSLNLVWNVPNDNKTFTALCILAKSNTPKCL